MATLAIDRDFLLDIGNLERPVRRRVREVFDEFEAGTHTGLHLERINNARNDRYRSIRINQFMRGIVLAPESGDTYLLLKVLPHNDAYQWAQRRNVSVNSATGGIEIRDEEVIEQSIPQFQAMASASSESLLFEGIGDADLARLGIDDSILALARSLTQVIQLEACKSLLPSTQWEVLYALAAGYSPEDVWQEFSAGILDGPVDVDDLDTAIARSKNRVVLVNGPDELLSIFEHPLALWRVYLHPTQQAVVDTNYRGPARVTGGPGTGKTVVALHRAKRLAEQNRGQVLVTTFTSTLSESLQAGINLLVESEATASRIDVHHVDRLAHRVFRDAHGAPSLISNADEREIWESIVKKLGIPFNENFLAEEWRHVVLAQRVSSAADYLAAKRTGRGRRLGSTQRAQVWQAVWAFESALAERTAWTHETVRREATKLLESRTDKPYRHIVVDEAQDLSPDQWRLLRAAVPSDTDDIFIAGDAHQRIYDNRVSLREVGISVTGRSSRLVLNYRTTAEILEWSLGILHGESIDDMDGGLDSIAGCRSEVHGQPPTTKGFGSLQLEVQAVAVAAKAWIDKGIEPSEIGIAVRSKWMGDKVRSALFAADVPAVALEKADSAEAAVHVGTMHRMKGLEFRCLAVAGAGEKQLPASNAVTPAEEDQHTHEQDLQRERCLLFVACTRAREELLVTWTWPESEFLTPLIQQL